MKFGVKLSLPDTILDDVNALLLKDVGDKHVLAQIKRAAENGEAISIYERNYVTKLKSTYPDEESSPPVKIVQAAEHTLQRTAFVPTSMHYPAHINKKPKPMKLIIGIFGIVIIAAAAAGISFLDIDFGGSFINLPSSGILLSADQQSYNRGDIISISGESDISLGDELTLLIAGSDGILIWSETVNLKSDGAFSTLLIAGGDDWVTGSHTLLAQHDDLSHNIDFSFAG